MTELVLARGDKVRIANPVYGYGMRLVMRVAGKRRLPGPRRCWLCSTEIPDGALNGMTPDGGHICLACVTTNRIPG